MYVCRLAFVCFSIAIQQQQQQHKYSQINILMDFFSFFLDFSSIGLDRVQRLLEITYTHKIQIVYF